MFLLFCVELVFFILASDVLYYIINYYLDCCLYKAIWICSRIQLKFIKMLLFKRQWCFFSQLTNQLKWKINKSASRCIPHRENKVSRHSFLHFAPKIWRHFASTPERRIENINLNKYYISTSGDRTHIQSI